MEKKKKTILKMQNYGLNTIFTSITIHNYGMNFQTVSSIIFWMCCDI